MRGKGKVIDWLASQADVVARYQGGANAGHTVVVDGDQYILHLVPTGILHAGVKCIIGSGVVVDPLALVEEIEYLRSEGIEIGENLVLGKRAHLIMPYHKVLDSHMEELLGVNRIGTTGRGIGPAYSDKAARLGVRISDLFDEKILTDRIRVSLAIKKRLLGDIDLNEEETKALDEAHILDVCSQVRKTLGPHVRNTDVEINDALSGNKKILLEGAQGILLDLDMGTYPYVTSSNTGVGGAMSGLGLPYSRLNTVFGIMKAYCTRVGQGPFPSEMGKWKPGSFGKRAVSSAPPPAGPGGCGWFDAVAARHCIQVSGMDAIAVTKLDVLDNQETIRVCVGYEYEGERVTVFPAETSILEQCKPVYAEFPGWMSPTGGVKDYDALPPRAKDYIKHLEELTDRPVWLISTGPSRDDTICIHNPFDGNEMSGN